MAMEPKKIIEGGREIEVLDSLVNYECYGVYRAILDDESLSMNINVSQLTPSTWQSHYDSVLNLFRDGIEDDRIQNAKVYVTFADKKTIGLFLVDYLLNLIMWNMLIMTNIPIESKHIFFADEIKKGTIKEYIDKFFIDTNRKFFTNRQLNNIIDDALHHMHDINEFALFLSNTVNLEDNVYLMNECPEFYECMHPDMSQISIEDFKSVGMSYANRAINIMKNSKKYLGYDHCLADASRAGEGINPKQFKEVTISIGTKPDGKGGAFPIPIRNSFINGGVSQIVDYFIESSTGRTAQIIKFHNVGESGNFARLLGLNNMDSFLYPDPHYDCHSTNYIELDIVDKKTLKMLHNRYCRLSPNGVDILLKASDSSMIGKHIYLRSPITCASAARGQGICYKCYGDLAYTVYDDQIHFGVNIGRIASETLSSSLTQMLLSAKHLLETFIEKLSWTEKFNELFEVEGNVVRVSSDIQPNGICMVIDPDQIELENEEDDDLNVSDDDDKSADIYNEYITEFDVMQDGVTYKICNDKSTCMYISNELNRAIRKKASPIDGKIYIDFSELADLSALFIIPIENNELSKTLNRLQNLLNKGDTMKGMDIHQLTQMIIQTVIEGGLNISATHLEVIISNQCRDAEDILRKPRWFEHDPGYQILSLNKALTCNPSVTVSMSYQKVSKLLYNPLTYAKNGTSFMDLFFMEQPQYAIKGIDPPDTIDANWPTVGDLEVPVVFGEDPNGITISKNSKELDDDEE